MKTIGILGGMSAASTQIYYSKLCQLVRDELGSLHSPELLIRSLDFAPIEALQTNGNWAEAGRVLNVHAKTLEQCGAGLILLATNTMHKVAEEMMDGVSIPLLHIADTTAEAVRSTGLERPGLMATAFTMEQSFYTDRLRSAGLEPIIPEADDRYETHRIIYEELCRGLVTGESKSTYVKIADRLVSRGADCLILGCTEIGMLLNADNVTVPVFDTTQIHCEAAVRWSLG
jgi:aspartate racemase